MNYRYFTTTEVRIIRDNLHLTDKELAKLIGATKSQVHSLRRRQRLIKEHEKFSMLGSERAKRMRMVNDTYS